MSYEVKIIRYPLFRKAYSSPQNPPIIALGYFKVTYLTYFTFSVGPMLFNKDPLDRVSYFSF